VQCSVVRGGLASSVSSPTPSVSGTVAAYATIETKRKPQKAIQQPAMMYFCAVIEMPCDSALERTSPTLRS